MTLRPTRLAHFVVRACDPRSAYFRVRLSVVLGSSLNWIQARRSWGRSFMLLAVFVSSLSASLIPAPTARAAANASFYASPSSGAYNVGDVIRVGIMINSGGQAINAGEATVTWTPGLQYSFASTSGSIFTTWASGGGAGPVGSGSSVYFSGGLSNPGYNGSGGRVVTVIFNATTPGTYTVNVAGSQILANDGMGTNVLCCSSGATFTVNTPKPPVPLLTVNSRTHPNENQWYTSRRVELNWFATTAVGNYSFAVDRNPGTVPNSPNNGTINTSYDLDEGTWYFHLKGSNQTGGSTVHFDIHIDSSPPDDFSVKMDNGSNASNPTPKASFTANDGISGIDRYTAKIDDGEAFPLNPGDAIPKQRPGKHTIVVTAYDKAGNTKEAKTDFEITGIAPPKILTWPSSLVILQPMNYIGQSEAGDTISVFLNGKLLEQFLAKDKKASKAKDKGAGGFANGITWEYTYKPQLFPGNYTIRFSRVNSVGAESSPSPDLKLVITATALKKPVPPPWYQRLLLPLVVVLLIVATIINVVLFLAWRREKWLRLKGAHQIAHTAHEPHLIAWLRKAAAWKPLGWVWSGTAKAQRGFLMITDWRGRSKRKTPNQESQTPDDESNEK